MRTRAERSGSAKEKPSTENQYIKLYLDELNSTALQRRLTCLANTKIFAALLDPDSFRSHIFSKLCSLTRDLSNHEDQVISAILDVFAQMKVLAPAYYLELMSPLEPIASLQDPALRAKAVECVKGLTGDLPEPDKKNWLLPFFIKMIGLTSLYAKMSACELIPMAYSGLPESRFTIRSEFFKMSANEAPVVRQLAAYHVPIIAGVLTEKVMKEELYPVFINLTKDDWEEVRIVAVDSSVKLSSVFAYEDLPTFIVPIFRGFITDKSWKVRMKFTEVLPEWAQVLGAEINTVVMYEAFKVLSADNYRSVRHSIFTALSLMFSRVKPERVKQLVLPAIVKILKDPSVDDPLRRRILEILTRMPPVLGRTFTVENIIPMYFSVLSDPDEVSRYIIVKSFIFIVSQVGPDLLTEEFITLTKQQIQCGLPKLRVAVIECFIEIAKVYKSNEFQAHFNDIYFAYMTDPAYCVRRTGLDNLPFATSRFGQPWVKYELARKMTAVMSDGYKSRLTVLESLKRLSFDMYLFKNIIIGLMSDRVDYIRQQTALYLREHLSAEANTEVRNLMIIHLNYAKLCELLDELFNKYYPPLLVCKTDVHRCSNSKPVCCFQPALEILN